MISIMLCDDQMQIIEYYSKVIGEYLDEKSIPYQLSWTSSGEELLEQCRNQMVPDIVVLDIQLKGINGMEIARNLRILGNASEIIFLTAWSDYVFDAFDVEPIGYVMKDKDRVGRLLELIGKAVERVEKNKCKTYFTVETGSYVEKVLLSDIYYFSVKGRIITIHTKENRILYYSRMDHIENELSGAGFLRTHRSYLVNMAYIKRMDQEGVTLENGEKVPISMTKYAKVKKDYLNYLKEMGN